MLASMAADQWLPEADFKAPVRCADNARDKLSSDVLHTLQWLLIDAWVGGKVQNA